MRAIQVTEFGGPEVLVETELPDPVAGPGEVVVGVAVVDTIFLETQIRESWGPQFGVTPPYVPGGSAAGTVLSVGEGVDPSWTGRRVVAGPGIQGSYAEQLVAPVDRLTPVPDGLGLREAAALGHDGVTGTGITQAARIQPGERVLILGASGGMGTLLVQLAHAAGARVVGAARGKRKLDLVRELGADAVVDYSQDGWADRAREALGGAGADLVLDGVGGELGLTAFELTATGGRFSAHGASSGGFSPIDAAEAQRRGITLRGITEVQFEPDAITRLMAVALAEAAAGRLRPVIAETFPLARAADAHRAIEARSVLGKALLTVG
ncbi:zinc-binding dehydrogenase [Streptomyces sp. H27-C3]|uniref:zinc-binding dehydrogenase n=1 Tax=Streptomyces sp. H27-C3 TaxID=3046305 RepID=UPI0024B93185|nr:zinc-binding dehydrogenase [Streptomyces sp. H27-C3]MDJ0466331.1 zinc-binding dehydrogenase [Streptomyces sp. H27-C3]